MKSGTSFKFKIEKPQVRDTESEIVNDDSGESFICESGGHSWGIDSNVLAAIFGQEECMLVSPDATHTFIESRKSEIDGLLMLETFNIVKRVNVPKGSRIYGSRWVDILKADVDGTVTEKSRLVAQNYRDRGATTIATKSPTIKRMGQRIALSLAPMMPTHRSYTRDISQAYLQSQSKLGRRVYPNPPPEMGLADDEVLFVLKPLYRIPESGLHWFITYQAHYKERLGMRAVRAHPCLLYRRDGDKLEGVTVLQVGDSYGHGTDNVLDEEEQGSKSFQCKPRKMLTAGDQANSNGVRVSILSGNTHTLTQSDKIRSLKHPESQQDFVSVREKAQYIGCCTRPDICAVVQLLASSTVNPLQSDYKILKKVVARCHETADVGLRYKPLDTQSTRLVLFTYASFANAKGLKSQIGFVLVLADDSGDANIIHYGSSRCKRVTRSVMAAEIHALVYGFDNAYVARDMLEELLAKQVHIDSYVESRALFYVVTKNSSTLEKRLQIDVFALRESHARGELRYLAWVLGDQNYADGLTKGIFSDAHPLWEVMTTNKLQIEPQG